MFTKTSISPVVIMNVLKACKLAMVRDVAHVRNRKGNAYLAVRAIRCGGRLAYEVLDVKGRNVSQLLKDAVKRLKVKATFASVIVSHVVGMGEAFTLRQTAIALKHGKERKVWRLPGSRA